jgi:hypothetical protein
MNEMLLIYSGIAIQIAADQIGVRLFFVIESRI